MMESDFLLIRGHKIPVNLPFRSSFDPIREMLVQYERLMTTIPDAQISDQHKLMHDWLKGYLEVRSGIDGVAYPVEQILSQADHKDGYRLWRAVTNFV